MLRNFQMALAALIGLMIVAALVTAQSNLAASGSSEGGAEFALEVPGDGELPDGGNAAAEPSVQAVPGVVSDNQARNVGGGLIAATDAGAEPLERIEALPKPTPPAPPEPSSPNRRERWKLIYNSVISAAGVFDLNGTTLVLPGIDIIPVNEACTAPNGVHWPCGMVARTAFRNYVKGRAVTCKVPDAQPQDSLAAECLLAGQDMAAWLVGQGWARAKPDALYADLETTAKSQQRGIHGNPPRGVEPVGDAEPVPVMPAGPAVNP